MPPGSVAWAELFEFSMTLAALCLYTKSGESISPRHGNAVCDRVCSLQQTQLQVFSPPTARHELHRRLARGRVDCGVWYTSLAFTPGLSICVVSQQPQSSAGKELLLSLVSNACNSWPVAELFFLFLTMVKQAISLGCVHALTWAC